MHGIAHQKEGASIARFPTRRQLLDQLKLSGRSILKLVYQQMLDALAQRQCKILRFIQLPQRGGGADRQLREVHAPSFPKYELQFRHRQFQDRHRGLHGLPLRLREPRRRQFTEARQTIDQRVFTPQDGEQVLAAGLHRMSGHPLAQFALLGEQQVRDLGPSIQIPQSRAGESVEFAKERNFRGKLLAERFPQLRDFAQNQPL